MLETNLKVNSSYNIHLDKLLGVGGEAIVIRNTNTAGSQDEAIKIIPYDVEVDDEEIIENSERRFDKYVTSVASNRCKEYFSYILWQFFSYSAGWIPTLVLILAEYFVFVLYNAFWFYRFGWIMLQQILLLRC